MRHVDAVVVRIANLWRRADHHNLLGVQAIENLEDALPERSAANYRVIDDDEVVLVGAQRTVGDVVDMSRQVVALRTV